MLVTLVGDTRHGMNLDCIQQLETVRSREYEEDRT